MSFFENDPAAGGARHKGSKHNVGHETGDRGKKEPGKRRNAHIRCDPKENFVSNGCPLTLLQAGQNDWTLSPYFV